ncbi:hypothetical protein C8Q80DRAFT_212739 [Daedaleopsis nitida]|nr:hypothetical protein C8Q80DRAFT_212739 [Daedaleopsis nitida]
MPSRRMSLAVSLLRLGRRIVDCSMPRPDIERRKLLHVSDQRVSCTRRAQGHVLSVLEAARGVAVWWQNSPCTLRVRRAELSVPGRRLRRTADSPCKIQQAESASSLQTRSAIHSGKPASFSDSLAT